MNMPPFIQKLGTFLTIPSLLASLTMPVEKAAAESAQIDTTVFRDFCADRPLGLKIPLRKLEKAQVTAYIADRVHIGTANAHAVFNIKPNGSIETLDSVANTKILLCDYKKQNGNYLFSGQQNPRLLYGKVNVFSMPTGKTI